jgi:hypothetical protein
VKTLYQVSFANAMRLVPMNFRPSNLSAWQAYLSEPFQFTPASGPVKPPKASNIPNSGTLSYQFDF